MRIRRIASADGTSAHAGGSSAATGPRSIVACGNSGGITSSMPPGAYFDS